PAANRPPAVDSLREIGRNGFEVVLAATAVDPDGDALTYTFDWGDGAEPTDSAGGIAVHAFPRNRFDLYTVTVTVDDGRGGQAQAQIQVDFPAPAANRAPSIEVARVLGINGFEAVLTATAADPDGDALTYTFDWGDGSPDTQNAGGVAAHTFPANVFRLYRVTVTVDDGKGGIYVTELVPHRPPPAPYATPFLSVARVLSRDGFDVVVTATAVDPNGDDVSYTFDWGDGSEPTENLAGLADHTYPEGEYRAYTVTITADDGHGATMSTEVVIDFPPPGQNRAPVLEVARVLTRDGFEVTVTASAIDPDGDVIT
ncbi:MAG: PKD domain-containing protein, partial [Myxococcales bacterium]|nr:PKD domain-containing protein [Myxococcales bacterium]